MTVPFVIDRMQESDIPSLQLVAAESWRATYADIYPADYIERFLANAYSDIALRAALGYEQSLFLAAKEGERVVGFSQTGLRADEAGQKAQLFRIYVLPADWGRGIGRALLAQTETWLTEQGITGYACFVHARNEIGKAFYAKLGFVHQPAADHDDEWCLWKQLTES